MRRRDLLRGMLPLASIPLIGRPVLAATTTPPAVPVLPDRFDASTVQELSDAGADFRREGAWMLYHSRHLGIERAIEAGDAFLSRLEGEWWMSF